VIHRGNKLVINYTARQASSVHFPNRSALALSLPSHVSRSSNSLISSNILTERFRMREKWKKKRSRRLRRKRRKMRARSSECGRHTVPLSSRTDILPRVTAIKLWSTRLRLPSYPVGGIRSMFHPTPTFPTAALIALLWCMSSVLQQHTRLSSRAGVVRWSNSLYYVQQHAYPLLFTCEKASVI
jgi:hypothetical protein